MAKSEKYRVHEVAKDFGLPSKRIMEILTMYGLKPRNYQQSLNDHELSVIFEYLTQHNQVSSIEAIYADLKPKAASDISDEKPDIPAAQNSDIPEAASENQTIEAQDNAKSEPEAQTSRKPKKKRS